MTKKELYNFLMPVVSRWRWLLNRVFSIFNSILSNMYTMNSAPLTTVAICSIEFLWRVEFLKSFQIHWRRNEIVRFGRNFLARLSRYLLLTGAGQLVVFVCADFLNVKCFLHKWLYWVLPYNFQHGKSIFHHTHTIVWLF